MHNFVKEFYIDFCTDASKWKLHNFSFFNTHLGSKNVANILAHLNLLRKLDESGNRVEATNSFKINLLSELGLSKVSHWSVSKSRV